MGTRGRISAAASLTVGRVEQIPRPDAPYDLTDEETEIWWAVVNALPADWFPKETHEVLTSYCRHACSAKRISRLIENLEKAKALDVAEYERLLKMRGRETERLASLATRMRITQQSTYDRKKAKAQTIINAPWD